MTQPETLIRSTASDTAMPLRLVSWAIDLLVRGCLIVACGVALFIALIGSIDVVSTFVFLKPVPLSRELPEELLVIIIFLGMPMAMRENRHVAVDLVIDRLGPRVQRVARVFVLALCTAIFGLLAWQSVYSAIDSIEVRETVMAVIRFPVWPIKCLMCLGLITTALETLRLFLVSLGGEGDMA